MAGLASIKTFSKGFSRIQGASRSFALTSPKSFPSASRRYCTMATHDEVARKGMDAAKRSGQQVKNEADNVAHKTKEMAGKMADTAQDAAGKVKQTAQDAWGSMKDTSQKIKDSVEGKAEASASTTKATVKDQAERIERCMNTKQTI